MTASTPGVRTAAVISRSDSVSSSTMSARPASDSETPCMRVNFCETGEQEAAGAMAFRFDGCLEMAKETGRVLHLVDDDGRRVAGEERLGGVFGLLGLTSRGVSNCSRPSGRSFLT